MRNLDVTALRSFVTVAQTGGVTRASGFLNLTQSAVSMQIKRLEDSLGLNLMDRSGRGVALTPAGEQLLSYAKRIVDMNDEVFSRLTDQKYEGEVHLGVPHDIVYPVIPQVLQRFHAAFPRVRVQLVSSYTNGLLDAFQKGELDVILTTESEAHPGAETLTEVPLRWVGAQGGTAWKQRPLRLAYCRFCRFRKQDVEQLDAAGVPWEIAVESDSDRTIEATVSADLAITSMLEGHEPPHLVPIDVGGSLPDLGMQKINMYGVASRPETVGALMDMVRQGFGSLSK